MPFKDYFLRARDELKSKTFWKGLRCELLGTLFYVLFGCSASLLRTESKDDIVYLLFLNSVSFGFAETVVVSSLGHSSGGHFNPAITIGMFITRYITLLKAFCFLVAQSLGGIAGIAMLYGVAPPSVRHKVGLNFISGDINEGQAFGFEFLGTLLVTYAFYATLENKNDILVPNPYICGLAVCLAGIFVLFWIAPVLGGVLGAFTFEYTKDSSKHLDGFRSSLRQRVYTLQRKEDIVSCNSVATDVNAEQELTTEEVQM
ncbi:hypothetical protein FSP39_000558 [Pinctada imbricata]|uniref:Uncharacterized protein n=1 Tax=Pinctada imbricata TaxID=66713 RepID=A0AA89BL89_PINIB|nr:hypothetical protein FSP39_000558 [Pinctada imbricata]